MPTKGKFSHIEIEDHSTYLERTLIPDLKESGKDATAEDFETMVEFLDDRELDETEGWDAKNFVQFLEDTLIPDLRESGAMYTADDFETGVAMIRQQRKMKPPKKATYSVRLGDFPQDPWLTEDGSFTSEFPDRARFKTAAKAKAAMTKQHPDVEDYGIYPNSTRSWAANPMTEDDMQRTLISWANHTPRVKEDRTWAEIPFDNDYRLQLSHYHAHGRPGWGWEFLRPDGKTFDRGNGMDPDSALRDLAITAKNFTEDSYLFRSGTSGTQMKELAQAARRLAALYYEKRHPEDNPAPTRKLKSKLLR